NIQIGNLIIDCGTQDVGTYTPALQITKEGANNSKVIVISNLIIKNSAKRGLVITGEVESLVIQTLYMENIGTEAFVMWGNSRAKILSGTVINTNKLFLLQDTAKLLVENVDFSNYTTENLSAITENAKLRLRNCTGIANTGIGISSQTLSEATQVLIPHGWKEIPESFSITPNSAVASGYSFATVDATNIT